MQIKYLSRLKMIILNNCKIQSINQIFGTGKNGGINNNLIKQQYFCLIFYKISKIRFLVVAPRIIVSPLRKSSLENDSLEKTFLESLATSTSFTFAIRGEADQKAASCARKECVSLQNLNPNLYSVPFLNNVLEMS